MVTAQRSFIACVMLANAMCAFAIEPSPQQTLGSQTLGSPTVPPHLAASPVPSITNCIEPDTAVTELIPSHHHEPYGLLSDGQLNGFRSAMQHLEAAGHREAAAELRSKLVELDLQHTKNLLANKTRLVEQLKAELKELSGADKPHTVTLSFQMFELIRSDLGRVDPKLDVANVLPDSKNQIGLKFVDDPAKLKAVIEALRKQGILNVIAEPTLSTISGRQVTFHSGGEIAIPIPQGSGKDISVELRKTGTIIHATPHLQPDGKLKVAVHFHHSEPDARATVVTDIGQRIPNFRTRQLTTNVVIDPGQAYVMGGLIQRRAEESKTEEGQITRKTIETELMLAIIPQVQAVE